MYRDIIKNRKLGALAILGWMLLNYPILSLLNLDRLWMGIPVLYAYLYFVWMGMILLIYRITRKRPKTYPAGKSRSEKRSGSC